jgi:hypothetical protein
MVVLQRLRRLQRYFLVGEIAGREFLFGSLPQTRIAIAIARRFGRVL